MSGRDTTPTDTERDGQSQTRPYVTKAHLSTSTVVSSSVLVGFHERQSPSDLWHWRRFLTNRTMDVRHRIQLLCKDFVIRTALNKSKTYWSPITGISINFTKLHTTQQHCYHRLLYKQKLRPYSFHTAWSSLRAGRIALASTCFLNYQKNWQK